MAEKIIESLVEYMLAARKAKLPEEVQQVLRETAEDYRDELARETDRRAAESRALYLEYGGKILTLSDEQRREWATGLPNLADDWVQDMEERGYPGRAILEDYMDAMREDNQPIMRQWDRE